MSTCYFDGLLPQHAVVVEAKNENWEDGLFEEESLLVRNAVPKRVREFAAGRNCARIALRKAGVEVGPVLMGPHREPLFPFGVFGSITHTENFCCAAIIKSIHGCSIGIDAEMNGPLDEGVLGLVLTPQEIRYIKTRGNSSGLSLDRLIFSVKESFFKAFHQILPVYIDFSYVRVEVIPEARSCQIILTNEDHFSKSIGSEFVASYSFDEALICTAVSLPLSKNNG
jgi:4'-phosphopantetheinyl transferase EntD